MKPTNTPVSISGSSYTIDDPLIEALSVCRKKFIYSRPLSLRELFTV